MEMVHFIPSHQRRLAMKAAQSDPAAVLIFGSSGTGKSAMGKWIHANSPRSAKPLIVFSRTLPLATQITLAQSGTLFISEITEIALGEQKQLFDFLKSRSLPHPENPTLKTLVNTRIIAGTEHDLKRRVQGGMFNAELFERFKENSLDMPKLTERMDEFEDIAEELLKEITRELHKNHITGLSADAMTVLKSYDWPSNVRELRNTLRMAIVGSKGDQIEATDLPDLNGRRMDLRATRQEFEKIYLLELFKTFEWDVERVSRSTQMERGILLEKAKKLGIMTHPESI